MIDGTWLWYDWISLFVLLIAVSVAAMTTHHIILEKGRPVLAALGLTAWIYAGSFALMVFGHSVF